MRIFLVGCTLFTLSLIVHVLIWKLRLPKRHTTALLTIFSTTLFLWTVVAGVLAVPLWDFLHSALFFVSMSLSYVITYSAVEGDSPTLSLMRLLAEKGDEGGSPEEIDSFFARRPFIRARLAALLHSSLIKEENGRYFIAGKPSLPFRLILGFRKIYGGIPKGS